MKVTWGVVLYTVLVGGSFARAEEGLWTDRAQDRFDPVAVANCHQLVDHAPNPMKAVVSKNVDGDTVDIEIKGKKIGIRFLNIDTPETHYKGKNQGAWAFNAAKFLEQTLPMNTAVKLEFEGERCDHFGRILAYVYQGTKQINRLIIENSLAVNYCIFPNVRYCVDYAKTVESNIRARRGLFGSRTAVPYEWRKSIDQAPWDKYVGSLKSMLVYSKKDLKMVPVAERIFFMKKADVKAPFRWASRMDRESDDLGAIRD